MAALYLDIEISLLLSNPKSKARHTRELQLQGLPFALAISDSAERGHKTWLPKKLAELWAVMLPADLVVNWALISFDIPMMVANLARTQQVPVDPIRLPQLLFDPVACIEHTTVRMERLHVPAQVNLSRSKRGSDPEAVTWLRSGDPALVAEVVDYCRCDVELIIDLHRLICSGSWLHLPAQPGKREPKQELWVRIMPDSFAIDLSWWQPDNWAGPALAGARRQHGLALGRRHERTGAPTAQSTGRQPGFFLFWFATLGHRATARSGRTTGAAQPIPQHTGDCSMAATRTPGTATPSGTISALRPIGIGPCFGINMGSGWGKLYAVFEPDEEAARVAAETAKATKDTAPDGIAGPTENELEVVFPAMIGEAGDAEGSIARVDTVAWDKLYVVGEDALARNPRTMPAQARLQDDDFLPIMTRGAFAKLMKLSLARIEVLITQEMFRLRGESAPPYSKLLADELERLRGVRFDPVKGEVGPISANVAETRPRPSKQPYLGANLELENQVRAKIVEREGRRGALPEQVRGGWAVTGLPASWIDVPGYQGLLGKRLRAGAPGITRMRSIAEPLAILYSLALNGNGEEINPALMTGRYGFVDMGFLTVDVDEVFNMRPQEDGRDTWDLGAAGPVGQIRRMLHAHFDTPFEPFEVEMAIQTGKIKVGGKMRDLPNHWDEPLNRQGRTIRDRLVHKWRSGGQFDAIFLGGGWAAEERIIAPILTTFGNAQGVQRSQTSIARGYAYLARRQAAEDAIKNAQKAPRIAVPPALMAETAGV